MDTRSRSGERILPARPSGGLNKRADMPAARLGIGGVGRIYVWEDGSLWIGHSIGSAVPHAHHAVQITFSMGTKGEPFELHAVGSPCRALRFAIVPAHVRHIFDGRGGRIAHLFVSPESREGRALAQRFGAAGVAELAAKECEAAGAAMARAFFTAERDERQVLDAAHSLVHGLAGTVPTKPLDRRIAAVRAHVARNLAGKLTLAEAARAAHLSPGRLRHVFVDETGTTFRAYVVWQRLLRATTIVMKGGSWTEAAHDTGFADSAHLSRSFRRMFGVSPAMIVPDGAGAAG